jgi:hypothetical protein
MNVAFGEVGPEPLGPPATTASEQLRSLKGDAGYALGEGDDVR